MVSVRYAFSVFPVTLGTLNSVGRSSRQQLTFIGEARECAGCSGCSECSGFCVCPAKCCVLGVSCAPSVLGVPGAPNVPGVAWCASIPGVLSVPGIS